MKSTVVAYMCMAAVSCAAADAYATQPVESDIIVQNVPLRAGASSDVHVRVFANPHTPCQANTLFAIHGVAHTAATWAPLAEAIFDQGHRDRPVCRLVAIDLPGHGASSYPTGMLFGDITPDDYVTSILATMARLESDHQIRSTTLLGHSMGGLLVQSMQQRLLDQGSSLHDAFHINHAVLMAPALPLAIPSSAADNGIAAFFTWAFGVSTPALGSYLDIPPPVWATAFFQNLAGEVAPGAPTVAEAMAKGYIAYEPMAAFSLVTGVNPAVRVEVDDGIFNSSHGTDMDLVSCEQDGLLPPSEHTMLYEYLTGDETGSQFTVATGRYAGHELHVSDPQGWLAATAGRVALP